MFATWAELRNGRRIVLPALMLLLGMALVGGQAAAGKPSQQGYGPAISYARGGHAAQALAPLDTPTKTATATPSCPPAWRIVPSPNFSVDTNFLFAVAAVSATDVWAVGAYDNRTLALHWDGSQWTRFTSPSPGTETNSLVAVGAIASNDVWAVGFTYSPGAGRLTLTEHWNGIQWSIVPSPNPRPVENYLSGVSAVASNDVWAVGLYDGSSAFQTLIEHWDGKQWSIVPSPNVSTDNNELSAVSALSATDVWAVGYYSACCNGTQTLTEHWDGTQWTYIPSPTPSNSIGAGLSGVSAISTNDVWAIGGYGIDAGVGATVILHWNGSQWSIVPSPNYPDNLDYSNTSPISNGSNIPVAHLTHFNHSTRPDAYLGVDADVNEYPMTDNSQLYAVSATSPNDVWAVGYHCCGSRGLTTLAEHWDGNQWSVVSSPNATTNDNYLYGVAAVSSGDVWAVGYSDNCLGCPFLTMTEHYSCAVSTPSPTPTSTSTPTATAAATPIPMLMGHVEWEARPAQPNTLQQLPITLTLQSGTIEVNYPTQLTDQYGFFTVTVGSLPNGTYNWRVDDTNSTQHSPNYLANSGTVDLTGGPITNVEMGLMRAGDANNDNLIGLSDFNMLKVSFGSECADPQYDRRTDFTGDCQVNIADFNPLKANYGHSGAPPIRPTQR